MKQWAPRRQRSCSTASKMAAHQWRVTHVLEALHIQKWDLNGPSDPGDAWSSDHHQGVRPRDSSWRCEMQMAWPSRSGHLVASYHKALSHSTHLIQGFLSKHYTLGWASSGSLLSQHGSMWLLAFPQAEMFLNGTRFQSRDDIMQNVTNSWTLSQNR